jgi:hypothetical protein
MTYTFDPALADNVSLVRFHCGDNHDEGHFLENETVQYFITLDNGEIGKAVVKSIQYIITQLSTPNFSVGWMNVSTGTALAGYEKMLIRKAQEFNLNISGVIAATSVKNVSRSDSYQTDNIYTGGPP